MLLNQITMAPARVWTSSVDADAYGVVRTSAFAPKHNGLPMASARGAAKAAPQAWSPPV